MMLSLLVLLFSCTLCTAPGIPFDLWYHTLGFNSDDDLFKLYFGNVCGFTVKMATGREMAHRRSEFTYTLSQLLRLRKSFQNLYGVLYLLNSIQPEICRLKVIQNGIETDYSQNSTHKFINKAYLRGSDLRGVVFPNNALRMLILRGNQIGPSMKCLNFDRKLRVLDLSDNCIEDLNTKHLPRQLVRLVLSNNPLKGHLRNLPAFLEDLEVNGCKNLLSVEIVPYLRYIGISDSGIKHPDNLIIRGFIPRIEIMQLNVSELLSLPLPLSQTPWVGWAIKNQISLRSP